MAADMTVPLMSERRVGLIGGLMTAIGPISMALYTPAMPEIVRAFDTTEAMVKMTLTLYFGGFAAGQLVAGPLSDALGRRAVTYGFMGVYCLASLAGLMAPDVGLLMAARFVQGIGASAGVAISRALVRDLFQGERSARIMNLIGIILAAGPAVAPTIGGLLLVAAGWRAIFVAWSASGWRWSSSPPPHARDRDGRPGRLRPRALAAATRRSSPTAASSTSAGIVACAVGALYAQATFLPFILMDRVGLARPASASACCSSQAASSRLAGDPRAPARPLRRGRLVAPGLGFIAAGSLGLAAAQPPRPEPPRGDAAGRASMPSASPSSCRRRRPPRSRPSRARRRRRGDDGLPAARPRPRGRHPRRRDRRPGAGDGAADPGDGRHRLPALPRPAQRKRS